MLMHQHYSDMRGHALRGIMTRACKSITHVPVNAARPLSLPPRVPASWQWAPGPHSSSDGKP